MPGYCFEALHWFQHIQQKKQDQPHQHTVPTYVRTIQYAKEEDSLPKVGNKEKLYIQQVTVTFCIMLA